MTAELPHTVEWATMFSDPVWPRLQIDFTVYQLLNSDLQQQINPSREQEFTFLS